MQDNAAQHLDIVWAQAQHPVRGFPHGGKGFRQDIVLRFPLLQPGFELLRFCPQLGIGQLPVILRQGIHGVHGLPQLFELALIAGSQQFLHKLKHVNHPYRYCFLTCSMGKTVQNSISPKPGVTQEPILSPYFEAAKTGKKEQARAAL